MISEKKYKILVVDDSEITISFLKDLLENYSFEVMSCNDGLEGIQKASELKPDLIILDLMMPNLDGIKTLQVKNVLKEIKDIPVIVISANTDRRNVLAAIDAGASKVISKPLQKEILINYIGELLNIELNTFTEKKQFSDNEKTEMTLHLRKVFLENFPDKKIKIQQSLKIKDIEKIREIAHDLKGAGGLVGLPHISAICSEIEKREIKTATDWVFIEFRFNELFQEVLKLNEQKK